MTNNTLTRVIGLVIGVYIVTLAAIMIVYQGPISDKVIAAGILTAAVGPTIPAMLSLKQSVENGIIAEKSRIETKVEVKSIAETVDATHKAVNSGLDKWKQAVIDKSEDDRKLWESRSRELVAEALALGLSQGREVAMKEINESILSPQINASNSIVLEASRVAQIAAETAKDAADKIAQVAVATADKLALSQVSPDVLPDGTLVVVAPAVISVKAPPKDTDVNGDKT